jgi:hypothetical protein
MAPQDVDIGMEDLRNTDSNVPKGPYIANGSVDHIVPNDHSDDEEMNHETLTLPEVDSNRTDVVQRRKEFRGRHIQMMALGAAVGTGLLFDSVKFYILEVLYRYGWATCLREPWYTLS